MKQSFLMSLKTVTLKASLTEHVLEVQILRSQPISTESESSGWEIQHFNDPFECINLRHVA